MIKISTSFVASVIDLYKSPADIFLTYTLFCNEIFFAFD